MAASVPERRVMKAFAPAKTKKLSTRCFYAFRPHTCATVYSVKAVSDFAMCSRQSARATARSFSLRRPSLRIVARNDSTVEGR